MPLGAVVLPALFLPQFLQDVACMCAICGRQAAMAGTWEKLLYLSQPQDHYSILLIGGGMLLQKHTKVKKKPDAVT